MHTMSLSRYFMAAVLLSTAVCSARDSGTTSEVVIPQAEVTQEVETSGTEALLESLYAPKQNGFVISQEQTDLCQKHDIHHTYGEALFSTMGTILDNLPRKITRKDGFVDLGSGVGKVVLQAALDYPFGKVVGVEFAQERVAVAEDVVRDLEEMGALPDDVTVEFINDDFANYNFKGITIVYMCSTCYSHELLTKLQEKFSKLKPGFLVITLKALPDHEKYGLELIQEYKLPMTWSKDTGGSPVHVYQLTKKPKKEKKVVVKKTTRRRKKNS